jgi:hypothetical protein
MVTFKGKNYTSCPFPPFNLEKKMGKIHFTPLKFQGFFNFNPKVLKLAIYSPEVSKNGNINSPLNFSVKLDGKL